MSVSSADGSLSLGWQQWVLSTSLGFVGSPESGEPVGSLHVRIEALFRAHVDAVYNVAYRVLWNASDAEDVVQAAFVKAFTRLDQLEDQAKTRPWLLQIAYREAITIVRRRRDVPTDPTEMPETTSDDHGPDEQAIARTVADQISQALAQLPEDERMAVVLRDVEELPMREVAEVLEIGLSAAKMRVHRGRAELRRLLSSAEVR